MLIALPLAVGLVAALAWRHAGGPGERRAVFIVAALALAIRLLAVLVVYLVAREAHGTGVWLNDEASFFLATESLLPNPLVQALPVGLDHLGGDGYLGLTTALALAGGVADANVFRVANAGLGAATVVLSMLVARRLFGARAGLVAGLVLAIWPTLVLWSATMLRDTLGSFAVVAVWWALGRSRDTGVSRVQTVCAIFLSLVILFSMRPYLGGAFAAGVASWALLENRWLRTWVWFWIWIWIWIKPGSDPGSMRNLVVLGAGAIAVGVAFVLSQPRAIEFAAHDILYRQTVSRMETLGRLYTDQPPPTQDQAIKPGAAVAIVVDADSGWLLAGIVQDFDAPDTVRVAFTDESIRAVPLGDVVVLQSTQIPRRQVVAWIIPNLASYLAGTSMVSEGGSPAWIAAAVGWDAVLVLAIVAAVRVRLSPREWLFPMCIVGGTLLALVIVPGAPGNADRHRATQTLPLLVVLASGLFASRGPASRRPSSRAAASNVSISPATDAAAAISRMRSAR